MVPLSVSLLCLICVLYFWPFFNKESEKLVAPKTTFPVASFTAVPSLLSLPCPHPDPRWADTWQGVPPSSRAVSEGVGFRRVRVEEGKELWLTRLGPCRRFYLKQKRRKPPFVSPSSFWGSVQQLELSHLSQESLHREAVSTC